MEGLSATIGKPNGLLLDAGYAVLLSGLAVLAFFGSRWGLRRFSAWVEAKSFNLLQADQIWNLFRHVVKLIGWLLASLFVDAIRLVPRTLAARDARFRASGSNSAARRESVRRPAVGGHGCREEGCRTKSVFILDVDRIPPSGAGWVCLFSH